MPIEDKLKELCPAISNAMMVGDKRKYNVVLLTLKTVLDPETGLSTGKLLGDAERVSASCTTDKQAIAEVNTKGSTWQSYLQGGIDTLNTSSRSRMRRGSRSLRCSRATFGGAESSPRR